MYKNLIAQLQEDEIVLTPNRRLARFLQNEYQRHQGAQQKTWLTPKILPLTTWLENLWEELLVCGLTQPLLRLTSYQERVLWQQTIQSTAVTRELLHTAATTYPAQQAWELCQQWQIDISQPIFTYVEETASWQQWAQQFIKLCANNGWLDHARVANHLTSLISDTRYAPPRKIFLAGFEEISPQHQQLFNALSARGCSVEQVNYAVTQPNIARIGIADESAEIKAMAQWAHYLWQQNPTQTIACIVPNLTEIRDEVLQVFTELFAPANLLPGHLSDDLPFTISASPKLSDYPIIHDALALLKLDYDNDFPLISYLLRSPYLGGAQQEISKRALLDDLLRNRNEMKITLHQLQVYAKQADCTDLVQRLQQLRDLVEKEKAETQHPASTWAKSYAQKLKLLGWPGENRLNSEEYQLCQTWQETLSTFASLDTVKFQCNKMQALTRLEHLADETAFQAKNAITNISILGTLEAAGMGFDHLWLMGLAENVWPQPAQPNPFIPIRLQRQLQLPHASNEREFKFCHALTQRLTHSAQHVVISYPLNREDQPTRPSCLIDTFPALELMQLPVSTLPAYSDVIHAHSAMEFFTDVQAEALPENTSLPGGSALFKHQAACPFRAFSYFRLQAEELGTPSLGLNALERGSLLHNALESVWNLLQDSQRLQTCSEQELQKILEQATTNALMFFIKKRPRTFHKRFAEAEKKRLKKLLLNWLTLEKQRNNFTVIAVEKSNTVVLNGIHIKLRVDRIDKLADQNYLIIDYKTSQGLSPQDWFSDRPDEPQLPLYCISSELPIQGIAFAQLTANSLKFSGISAEEISIPGITPVNKIKQLGSTLSWAELKQNWQAILTELSREFRSGNAKVTPKENKKTCQHCGLQVFCRIDES